MATAKRTAWPASLTPVYAAGTENLSRVLEFYVLPVISHKSYSWNRTYVEWNEASVLVKQWSLLTCNFGLWCSQVELYTPSGIEIHVSVKRLRTLTRVCRILLGLTRVPSRQRKLTHCHEIQYKGPRVTICDHQLQTHGVDEEIDRGAYPINTTYRVDDCSFWGWNFHSEGKIRKNMDTDKQKKTEEKENQKHS